MRNGLQLHSLAVDQQDRMENLRSQPESVHGTCKGANVKYYLKDQYREKMLLSKRLIYMIPHAAREVITQYLETHPKKSGKRLFDSVPVGASKRDSLSPVRGTVTHRQNSGTSRCFHLPSGFENCLESSHREETSRQN